jgi:hypothetical protein
VEIEETENGLDVPQNSQKCRLSPDIFWES